MFAQKKASFQMGLFNEKKSVYLISCLLAMLNNCMVKEQFQNKKGSHWTHYDIRGSKQMHVQKNCGHFDATDDPICKM